MNRGLTRSALKPNDRKHLKRYNTEVENGITTHYLYLDLITKLALGRILGFLSDKSAEIRMYPYKNLICVEIKTKQQKT